MDSGYSYSVRVLASSLGLKGVIVVDALGNAVRVYRVRDCVRGATASQTSRYQYHLRFVANPHERQSDHRQILSVPICLTSIQGAREQLKGPDHTFLFSLSP